MGKKLFHLFILAFLFGFIVFTDNTLLAGDDDEDNGQIDIDDVSLSGDEAEMLADKGQIRDLKGRINGLKTLRITIENNQKTMGDDIIDNTSLLSDIDRLISDLENAEEGELTQGEYFALVRDHVDFLKKVENCDTEMKLAEERGELKIVNDEEGIDNQTMSVPLNFDNNDNNDEE